MDTPLASGFGRLFSTFGNHALDLCCDLLGWHSTNPLDLSKHEILVLDVDGIYLRLGLLLMIDRASHFHRKRSQVLIVCRKPLGPCHQALSNIIPELHQRPSQRILLVD